MSQASAHPESRAAAPHLGEAALGSLENSVAFHLRLAQETSFQAFARRVGAFDLRPGHYAALAIIGENSGITQTALSRASGRDTSSLTPVLDALAERGLVVRERVATNRRSYALALTDHGRAALTLFQAHAAAHDADLDRVIGPESKADLIGMLRCITEQLG